MRLCYVTSEFVTEPNFSGGLASYLQRVCPGLVEMGHEVHVLVPSGTEETLDYRGVHVHRVLPVWHRRMWLDRGDRLVPRSYYTVWQDGKAARSLWKAWQSLKRRQRFDLVQIANCQSAGMMFRRERRVPVVARVSNFRPECDRFNGVPITRAVRVRWAMERRTVAGARSIYTSSHFLASELREKWNLTDVHVVEPPYATTEVQWDAESVAELMSRGPYGLFYGGLTLLKGVHLLAEALGEVLSHHPNMRFIFVGRDGIAPGGGSMVQHISERLGGLREQINFAPPLRHPSLFPLVHNAQFVALPSLYDNLPNACLEAMGMGKVVVALSGSCFEQLIEDERSGLLADRSVPGDLARKVEIAWRLSSSQRHKIGEAARSRIAKLAPEKALAELLAYYQRIVS